MIHKLLHLIDSLPKESEQFYDETKLKTQNIIKFNSGTEIRFIEYSVICGCGYYKSDVSFFIDDLLISNVGHKSKYEHTTLGKHNIFFVENKTK